MRVEGHDTALTGLQRDLRLKGQLTLPAAWTEAIPGMGAPPDTSSSPGVDLARGRPALASSSEREDTKAENAVDDNGESRWSSQFSDPQWLRVDLGRATTVARVLLRWETAFAAAYRLEVSLDGREWREVYATATGQGGEELLSFAPAAARYVRLTGTRRGTEYGYSLYTPGGLRTGEVRDPHPGAPADRLPSLASQMPARARGAPALRRCRPWGAHLARRPYAVAVCGGGHLWPAGRTPVPSQPGSDPLPTAAPSGRVNHLNREPTCVF